MPQFDNLYVEQLSPTTFREALQGMCALKNEPMVPPIDKLYVNDRWQIDYARLQQEDPALLLCLEQSAQGNCGEMTVPLELLQSMIERKFVVWVEYDK